MKYVSGTEQDMVAGSDALITRAPGGERGPSPSCSPHTRGLCQSGAIVKSAPLLLLQPRIVMPRHTYTVPFLLFHVWDGLISQSWRGEERNSTDLVAPHLSLLYHSPLSCKTLFVIEPDFPALWTCRIKNVFNLTLSAKLDHLGPVFVSMAVLLLSSRVC